MPALTLRCLAALLALLCGGVNADPPALQDEVRVVDRNGALIKRLNFKGGRLHGEQRYYFEKDGNEQDGSLQRIAHYRDGLQTGLEQWFDRAGRLTEEIPYQNHQVHGEVRRYYPDGSPREQVWFREGKETGVFKSFDENGRWVGIGKALGPGIIEKHFRDINGELTRHKVHYHRDSEQRFTNQAPLWLAIEVRYYQGWPVQADIDYPQCGERWIEYFDRGALVELHHSINELPEGLQISRKGQLVYRETYRNGRLHGPWRLETTSGEGVLWGQYRNDKRVGEWHRRHRDGAIETFYPGGQQPPSRPNPGPTP